MRKALRFFDRRPSGTYHARAMGDPLQDRRPLAEWVAGEQVIEISDNVGSFDRLADAIRADLAEAEDESADVDLREFDVSGWIRIGRVGPHDDRPCVTGELETVIPATCQRCMKTFRMPLSTELRFELKSTGESKDGAMPGLADDGLDAWELADGAVRPLDIVDEALVMAIPLVAKHDYDCVELDEAPEGPEMTSPFASLREQMDKANKD